MSTSVEVLQNGQVVRDSSTTKKINNLLNSTKSRLEGLQLLNLFLPQCSDEDFVNCCINWMQNCCKVDGSIKSRNHPTLLLSNLIKISSNYPELKKSVSSFISTRYFDFFFKHLLSSEAGWSCTETCLCLYRGACGQIQERLEKHLIDEIEKNVNISSTIGRCFALLPCSGGGGNERVNYKKNWKDQFIKFLGICHSILNDLFADVEDFKEYETLEHAYNKKGREKTIEYLSIQLQNHSSVLGFMLLNEYPAPKNVPTDLIFQLICRGLAINSKAVERRQTAAAASLQKALPVIHAALLSLMKAVIVTCKNQLLPYSHLICKLIKQNIQWSESDVPYESEKSFVRLRVTTYETLCDWLIAGRSGSCVELISDVVVSTAVNDIRSKKEVVLLKGAKLNRPKGREQTTRQVDAKTSSKLCRAALRSLQFLLKFVGVLLKAEVHKFLQEVVVKLLVEVQKSSAKDMVTPFAVPACRTELYSLLLELIHQPCPKWPPPTNFALRLFRGGVNDSSPEVSSFCSAALNFTTVIIHPEYDNGRFPLCDTPGTRSQTGDEPMQVENEEEAEISQEEHEEKSEGSDDVGPSAKAMDAVRVSEFSSDEDSRNTVTFSKDTSLEEALEADEGKKDSILEENPPAEDGPSEKRRRLSTEEVEREKTPVVENRPTESTPVVENRPTESTPIPQETPESNSEAKPTENSPLRDSNDPKTSTPEATNEDWHPKARYFLRSTAKASSEEPEEALKRASSVESLKSTPKSSGRSTPSVPAPVKRPRTRALSKIGGNNGADAKVPGKDSHDEEEDIRAAFCDSFVD